MTSRLGGQVPLRSKLKISQKQKIEEKDDLKKHVCIKGNQYIKATKNKTSQIQ